MDKKHIAIITGFIIGNRIVQWFDELREYNRNLQRFRNVVPPPIEFYDGVCYDRLLIPVTSIRAGIMAGTQENNSTA